MIENIHIIMQQHALIMSKNKYFNPTVHMKTIRDQLRKHISAMPMAYMSNEHHGQFNGCNASASSKGE